MKIDPLRLPVATTRPMATPLTTPMPTDTIGRALPAGDDDLIKRGMAKAALEGKGPDPIGSTVLDGITTLVALPEDGSYVYESHAVSVGDDGSLAAIRARGPHDLVPRTIAFFSPKGDKLEELPSKGATMSRGPNGTIATFGGFWSDPESALTVYSPDGKPQWEIATPRGVHGASWRPDGSLVLSLGSGETLLARPDGTTPLPPAPEAVKRIVDGNGTICDLDLYTQTPSVTRLDASGLPKRTELPPIPGVTRDDYSGRGPHPVSIEDPMPLANGSVLVQTSPLKAGWMHAWLLIPGRDQAVDLSPASVPNAWGGFAEGRDGTLYGVHLKQGPNETILRDLVTIAPDGTEQGRTPLPPTRESGGREKIFLDASDHVLLFSNYLESKEAPAALQAFDRRGTLLWQKDYDWPRDLERVESLPDGTLNLYFQGERGYLRVRPFDDRSFADRKDDVARDLGRTSQAREDNAPRIIADGDFITVGGVKVPVRRNYEWKKPA